MLLDIILFLVTVYFAYTTFTTVSKARGSEEEQFIDDDVVDEKIIVCRTEIIANKIYVWNKLTNDFIVYGSSIQEIVEYFKKHHPGKKIVLLENENDQKDRT
jgi:hypothetical protein